METTKQCPRCGELLDAAAPEGLCLGCLMEAGLQPVGGAEGDVGGAKTTPHREGFVHPEPKTLADQFPELEILELVGRGGMGAVYKSRQRELDRWVALKILPPTLGTDPAFAERFVREARALAQLNHPHIVQVYDFGQRGEYYYFLMEFVPGANLRQLMQTGDVSAASALAIVPQICEALQFAHDEGIVHRDIKPENILLDEKGRVKIADFGLAKLAHGPVRQVTLTGTHQVMGTPRYMAPEQMEGTREVDHRADIYSLGVVFYELLTGELPLGRFDAPSQKVQVDVRLDEIVLRSLENEPSRRYQQASQIKTDLEVVSGVAPGQLSHAHLSGAASASAFSTIGLAWRQWWRDRSRWSTNLVQGSLTLLHGVCMILFLSMQTSSHRNDEGRRQFVYQLGTFSPWFTYETYPEPQVAFRHHIDFLSWSVLFAVIGYLLYGIVWQIEKAKGGKLRRWESPKYVMGFWLAAAIVAMAIGIGMGQSELFDKRKDPAPDAAAQLLLSPIEATAATHTGGNLPWKKITS